MAAGGLLALPWWVEETGPVVVLGLAAYGLAVDPRLFRRWLLASYGSVVVYVGLSLYWLVGFHPVAPLVLALHFGLYSVLAAWIHRRLLLAGAPAWLSLPLVWVTAEHMTRHASIFPTAWLNAGYALLPVGPVAQSADIWGVGGLTFLAGVAGGLLVEFLAPVAAREAGRPRLRVAGLLLLVLLAGGAALYGAWRARSLPSGDGLEVLLVQGSIPQAVKQERANERMVLQRHVDLTLESADPGLDLVAWPETTASFRPNTPGRAFWRGVVERLATTVGAPLLVGSSGMAQDPEGLRSTNSAYLFLPHGGEAGRYDKVVLVPFGEYVPLLWLLPEESRRRVQGWIRREFRTFPHDLPGPGPEPLLVEGERSVFRAGVLICYEDVMPGFTAAMVRRGADILVNPSNEAWYRPREMDQHVMIARMRSIENRRSMVRPTNTGLTVVIDPRGRVTGRLVVDGRDRDVAGTLRAPAPLCPTLSFYSRFGPLFARACLGMTLILLLAALVRGGPPPSGESVPEVSVEVPAAGPADPASGPPVRESPSSGSARRIVPQALPNAGGSRTLQGGGAWRSIAPPSSHGARGTRDPEV